VTADRQPQGHFEGDLSLMRHRFGKIRENVHTQGQVA